MSGLSAALGFVVEVGTARDVSTARSRQVRKSWPFVGHLAFDYGLERELDALHFHRPTATTPRPLLAKEGLLSGPSVS